MGRKGNWFSSVKNALSPEPKDKKGQKSNKSKKKWFGKEKPAASDSLPSETLAVSRPLPPSEEVKLTEVDIEQTKHAYSIPVATTVEAEDAVAAVQVAPKDVQLTALSRFAGKSKEEVAAIRIQTAFRGYLARRALRALRGLVRLKSLVEGPTVTRQTANTLRCMQTLARVHSQIHSRRLRMSEENQALQRQLIQKRARELENLRMGEEWDDSLQSKEQIEANLMSRFEAATRRERALAYSFSHQQTWKKAARSVNLLFMDPSNPQWGWSWLERWMEARPWDNKNTTEKESINDLSSVKSANISISGGEITKSYVRHQLNSEKASPATSQKPSHNQSPSTPTKSGSSGVARKMKVASPRGSPLSRDEDAKSVFSVQSERNRRHSVGGPTAVRDDESMASSPAVPSYMASTKSAKAKTRMQSPLGMENGTPDKEPAGAAKKRLSFPPSPAKPRRHSGPPKVDISSPVEHSVENGGTS